MIEQDTVKLLRECDSGVKMGVSSIEEVIDRVHSPTFRQYLTDCKKKHEKLNDEIQRALGRYHDDGKEPSPVIKGMSWIKTNMRRRMKPPRILPSALLIWRSVLLWIYVSFYDPPQKSCRVL